MSFKSCYSIFEYTPIILFLASIFLLSCSVEDLAHQKSDSNQTIPTNSVAIESVKSLSNNKILSSEVVEFLDSLLQKRLNEIVPKIVQSLPEPVKFDYERLENSFLKMLIDNKSTDHSKKYQFLCDENERWIYRCNQETGEIECFSMSSNKLRLLSSTK
jgi:hypothetical protein